MICQECQKSGTTSRVYESYTVTTSLMGEQFYDEEGRQHFHDPNIDTHEYACSKGHKWHHQRTRGCWCGWTGNLEETRHGSE